MYIKCKECECKNEIHINISNVECEEFLTIDHKGRKISHNGNVGKKLKNLKSYEYDFCECHGECNDEMGDNDVILVLDDGSEITGGLDVYEYLINVL